MNKKKQLLIFDKIRDEIIDKYWNCDICKYIIDYKPRYTKRGDIYDILQIIDKYRLESEDNGMTQPKFLKISEPSEAAIKTLEMIVDGIGLHNLSEEDRDNWIQLGRSMIYHERLDAAYYAVEHFTKHI